MRKQYDFSKAKSAPVVPPPRAKPASRFASTTICSSGFVVRSTLRRRELSDARQRRAANFRPREKEAIEAVLRRVVREEN